MFCVYDKLSYTTLVFISLSKLHKTEERTVFPNVDGFFYAMSRPETPLYSLCPLMAIKKGFD